MDKIYVGIDVGKKGAIVKLYPDGEIITKIIPLINNEIDQRELKHIITDLKTYNGAPGKAFVVIEDVHSIFGAGAKSNFQFGRTLGILEGMLNASDIAYTKVQPKAWQKVCFEGVPQMKKPGKRPEGRGSNDTKAMALIAAQRLYPNLDLRKSERAKVPHDGVVDALLMAHFAKLKF